MDFQSYWLFVCASVVLCIVPGPDMIYLLGRSIAQGRKAGIVAAIGINLGGYFHLLAAMLGISAIIATSSIAFTILKWCGAVYLLYLGCQALLAKQAIPVEANDATQSAKLKTIFWQGFVSDALNPKVAIFFISLLPQFIQPEAGNALNQLIILGITVNVIALSINIAIVLLSQVLTARLRQSSRISIVLHKAMGAVFVALGLRLANETR
ncbi:MAG: LysE family translocator [Kangiellaceae bacterium]|nr:LysE family translocator [Kangiellaceae bacterium]